MFAFNENKIYSAKMGQKLDEEARVERPLCKRKVAGSNPAESILASH